MKVTTLDFESYYDRDYSLRKMTPVEYILDPRFEAIGAAVKEDASPTYWVDGPDLQRWFDQADRDGLYLSHNWLFDGCVAAWRFGFVPRHMTCTMSIARAVLGHLTRSVSLASVATLLGLPAKGDTALKVQGMSLAAIKAAGLYDEYIAYSILDADICYGIYDALVRSGRFPIRELAVLDMVLRAAIKPRFLLDLGVLAEHKHAIRTQKDDLLARIGMQRDEHGAVPELMSNERFALLLEQLGVDPPTKISPATGKTTYAFSKTDPDFMDLQEHPDPEVQALIGARLGHKSTLEETRTERFIQIAQLDWGGGEQKRLMPVPLRYSGAHTHRLSGDWKLNCMHPDVELLTPTGWQRIEDWRPTTPIMQWWPDGRLTWEGNPQKVERLGESELIWFDSPFVKGGFTRDHRMAVIRKGEVVDYTAGRIAELSGVDGVPVSGLLDQPSSGLGGDQVRLLVALAADGSAIKDTPHWQWGFHKQRKADRLRQLLLAAGVKFSEYFDGKRWDFHTNPTVRACTGRPTQGYAWLQKGFGLWVLSLGASEMDALLDELVHWDGWPNTNSGQPTFITTQHDQALWVQTIAHLRNRPCTVKKYVKTTNFGTVDSWYVYFRRGKLTSCEGMAVPYSGPTYCPSVASSYVLVRYGDGVFVTGQCQNLPTRGDNNAIRRALVAPRGHVVLTVDASQIEARITAWICGQLDLVEAFAQKRDVYSEFASKVFGYKVERKRKDGDHAAHGFIGKTGVLGLGYGVGWLKFQRTVKLDSKKFTGRQIVLPDELSQQIVTTYRREYSAISGAWRALNDVGIPVLARGGSFTFGPCIFEQGAIDLPSGLQLKFHDLAHEDGEWWYSYGGKRKRLYGGALLENIVQALARIVTMDAALRIQKRLARADIWLNLQAHDELVYVTPEKLKSVVKQILEQEMRRRPVWAPDLPLDCEVGEGASYGDAK